MKQFIEKNSRREIVSFIIPIYNGEKYIDHCMGSVLSQTYQNFEVLLIDDGSKDNSLEICKKYEEKDSRVRVYHKENGGVSSARNLGLEKATGEFNSFVDVDDLLDKNFLEVMVNDAHKYEADIVCCAVKEIESNYNGRETGRLKTVSKRRLVHYFDDYFDDWFYGRIVWGRIIKRELAEQEKFSSLKFSEDTEYMLKLFAKSPTTYLDDYQGYYYIRWAQSVTNATSTIRSNRLKDSVALSKTVINLCLEHGNTVLIDKSYQGYANSVYSLLSAYIKRKNYREYADNKKVLLDMITVTKGKHISKKIRIAFTLYQFSPLFYWVIFRIILGIKGWVTQKK